MLVSFIHEDPVASENLMFFSLLSIDCRPRLKYVDMFVDLVLHRLSELVVVLMAFEFTVIPWRRWEVSLVSFSSLEGGLPSLRYSFLVEIEVSLILLLQN